MSARVVLVGLLAVCGLAVATAPAVEAARHGGRRGGVQLAELLAAAQAQQQSGQLAMARTSLEQAYLLQPSAELLCALGALATADGRQLDAQDALRRCALAGHREPPAATAPRPESGELSVAGPRRGFVFVDGHVVGALPLTAPLLLAPGPHRLQILAGSQKVGVGVQVLPGRAALLTLAGKVTVTPLPAVALLVDFSHSPEEAAPLLRQAATQAVQSQHLGLLGQWGGLDEKLELSGCPDASCEQTLAQRHQLRYVMAARAAVEPDGWQLWAQLFDAEVGGVASEQAADCEHCTAGQAGTRLGELLTQALQLGKSRPTGVLEVTSVPPGGEVMISGLRLGQTPLRRTAFAGEHAIVVQHAGFAPYQNEVVVEPGRGAALDATLHESVAEAAPRAPASRRAAAWSPTADRPRSRPFPASARAARRPATARLPALARSRRPPALASRPGGRDGSGGSDAPWLWHCRAGTGWPLHPDAHRRCNGRAVPKRPGHQLWRGRGGAARRGSDCGGGWRGRVVVAGRAPCRD